MCYDMSCAKTVYSVWRFPDALPGLRGLRVHEHCACCFQHKYFLEVFLKMATIDKEAIIKEYAIHEGDTGSPEVQIALLTARINHLNEHFKLHLRY